MSADGIDRIWMASAAHGAGAIADISARLRAAWIAISEAERARGASLGPDPDGTQAAYEAALLLFRRAQIEAFTVTLGAVPLIREQLAHLERLLAAMAIQLEQIEAAQRR
jgi:hypothetical protein